MQLRHDLHLQETIDTSTPAGRLFFTMIAAMAQWEREEIADRVKASVVIRAKLGKSINGRAPYGYQWKDKKLVPHPEEAPIRLKAYELFPATSPQRDGGQASECRPDTAPATGSIWRDTQVARVLTDLSAKGIYFFNRGKKHGDWKQTLKPESRVGQGCL